MSGSTIETTVTNTVTLGSASYPSPLTVTNTGDIAPSSYAATGLIAPLGSTALSLLNFGNIWGGPSGTLGTAGTGVSLKRGTTVTNDGTVIGGTGEMSSSHAYFPGTGREGGIGVTLSGATWYNVGLLSGGTGGSYTGSGGPGNFAVEMSGGTLGNTGTIEGGAGGSGGSDNGGNGGGGILLQFGTVTNDGTVLGGDGGTGANNQGTGGSAVTVGSDGTLINSGELIGGGGSTANGLITSAGAIINGGVLITAGTIAGGSVGGAAADAVEFTPAPGTLVVDPGAVFVGQVVASSLYDVLLLGSAGARGTLTGLGSQFVGFTDLTIASGADWTIAGSITGDAGLGVTLETGATLTNAGTITGGKGASYGYDGIGNGQQGNPGLSLAAASLINQGIIAGGAGGVGVMDGSGGDGVDLTAGAVLTNDGTITGGPSGFESPAGTGISLSGGSVATNVSAGVITGNIGIALDGGTFRNSGTIDSTLGSAGDAVQFGSLPSDLVIDHGAIFAGALAGFTAGDTIDLTSFVADTSSYQNGTLSLTSAANGVVTLDLPGDFTAASFSVTGDNAGGTDVSLACFLAGTRIATTRGEIAVETLAVGDHALARFAGRAEIVWIGHRTVRCDRHPAPENVWPVRIRAHAFGPQNPRRDLLLSPDHAVYAEGVLIPVRHLIDGRMVLQVECRTAEYWHVELSRHDVLLAEGLYAESYLDTGNRAQFSQGAPVSLHPDFAARHWERACAPLCVAGRHVQAVRRRLLARAAKRLGCAAPAPLDKMPACPPTLARRIAHR